MKKIALILGLLSMSVFAKQTPQPTDIEQRIAKFPQLNHLDQCPADVSPKNQLYLPKNFSEISQNCLDQFDQCFEKCTQDDGIACYLSAQIVERQHPITAQHLFQRSCELGVASGCTNRAAGKLNLELNGKTNINSGKFNKNQQCIAKTFKKSCDWKDQWGCTMYANELLKIDNSTQTYNKALDALIMSCVHGKTDPACQRGLEIKQYILEQINQE